MCSRFDPLENTTLSMELAGYAFGRVFTAAVNDNGKCVHFNDLYKACYTVKAPRRFNPRNSVTKVEFNQTRCEFLQHRFYERMALQVEQFPLTIFPSIQFSTVKSLLQLQSKWYKKAFHLHFCNLQSLLLMYYNRVPVDNNDDLVLTRDQIKQLLREWDLNEMSLYSLF